MFCLRSKSKGFSLVEIIVATAIIGFIAIMATPSVYKTLENGKNRTVSADLRTIGDALELYSIEANTFPANLDTLVTTGHIRDARGIQDKWAEGTVNYLYCPASRAGAGKDGLVASVGPTGEGTIPEAECNTGNFSTETLESFNGLYHIVRVTQ